MMGLGGRSSKADPKAWFSTTSPHAEPAKYWEGTAGSICVSLPYPGKEQ